MGLTVWAFDVDETLTISKGPVTLESMQELKDRGDIVGVCGNMQVFCSVPDWHNRVSFLGQGFCPKDHFLYGLKVNIPADDYVMVGNRMGVTGASDDEGSALRAGWRFILERDFAAGAR